MSSPDHARLTPDPGTDAGLVALGRAVIETEAAAVTALASRVDGNFVAAARHMLACEGRIVVLGMGKSGHIGGKIAATLASTGTPAFFVHPGEASHGDMGMITSRDVVLALSNSGETNELVILLPLIKRLGAPLIALTGRPDSAIGKAATVVIDVSVEQEACPLRLAPTSSTTAALAMGDALAIALLDARGFTADDFAFAHPGGTLGRRLLLKVGDLIHTGDELPRVGEDTLLRDALVEMTRKGFGMTSVIDAGGKIAGVFTDGDLRRALDRSIDVHGARMREVMTRQFKSIGAEMLAAEALALMQKYKISALLVVDESRELQGLLHMQDLLRAGVV
ncbi:MAG: Arabinose 5-phosphate isomerase KdsD [Gammaproteobacteria bacterium]|nr:Arabinose 5-phosphate isomerase KdsD [Gammaproteobacteria bacterium]